MIVRLQGAVEPMQVDAAPEENDNVEEEHYMVEVTTLVSKHTSFYNENLYDIKVRHLNLNIEF